MEKQNLVLLTIFGHDGSVQRKSLQFIARTTVVD